MLKADWEELVAQVDDHGPEAVEFHIYNADDMTDAEVWVDNVVFDSHDNKVRVILS